MLRYLPDNFDAREKWPNCETIRDIYDQNNGTDKCNSGLAISFASFVSDIICIKYGKTVRLSAEDFECLGLPVCLDTIRLEELELIYYYSIISNYLAYWIQIGLVTEECKVYDIPRLRKQRCKRHCVDSNINYKNDKHKGTWFHSLKSEDMIKAEIAKNGSIQATFTVYEDFLDYKGGIYDHTYGKKVSIQSVRVIGYGEENGVKYWLAANSWSSDWGEKGFFKIKRYQKWEDIFTFEFVLVAGIL